MDHTKTYLFLKRCLQRLLTGGHSSTPLMQLFKQAIARQNTSNADDAWTDLKKLCCHVVYHNRGQTTREIQHQFGKTILQPIGEAPLCAIKNSRNHSINPNLIVLYHRTKNLGNLLSPQKLEMTLEAAKTSPQPASFYASSIFKALNPNFFYISTFQSYSLQTIDTLLTAKITRQIIPPRQIFYWDYLQRFFYKNVDVLCYTTHTWTYFTTCVG